VTLGASMVHGRFWLRCSVIHHGALAIRPRRAASPKLGVVASCFPSYCFRSYIPFFAVLALTIALCGCSQSQLIDLYSADYRQNEATSGDAQLLLNILRAKDDHPIHFADIALIHGTLGVTASNGASIALTQFSTTPTTLAPSVSASSSPTFDVSTMDTQDFTRGILSNIDPRTIQELIEQGVDPRVVALLFVSEYRRLDGHVFFNNMSCDPSSRRPGHRCERVFAFLHEFNEFFYQKSISGQRQLQSVQTNIYLALTPVGDRLSGAWTLELRQLDSKKYKLIDKQLYSISDPKLAICYVVNQKLKSLVPVPTADRRDPCNYSEVIVRDNQSENGSLVFRSTYDIIQFLGHVLRFQEEEAGRCLTLDPDDTSCDTGQVLFQVNGASGKPAVATLYDGTWYGLYDRNCRHGVLESCDYSLQVLAILEMLLNANRSTKDILFTPHVQVTP
jgi:hypothetical protein